MIYTTKSFYISLAICLQASISTAQTDTALTFYPLGKGNRWQYLSETVGSWGYPSIPAHFYQVDIVGDTTLPNGKTYFIVESSEKTGAHPRLQRIDSVTAQIFAVDSSNNPQEYAIDSLRAPQRSGFIGCRIRSIPATIMWSIDSQNYFASQRMCRNYETVRIFGPYISYTLARDIGLAAIQYGAYDLDQNVLSRTTDSVVYAKIGAKESGALVFVPQQSQVVSTFHLYQNYPNPFNPVTTIEYQLLTTSNVSLMVFDLLGNQVTNLVNGKEEAGLHSVKFSGNNLSSGIYYYRLKAGSFTSSKKLILLK